MKKRFIAGAVCPECKQQDKLVMYDDELHQRWRECVSCDFRERLVEDEQPEIVTRVNQPLPGEKPLAHETEIQSIKIID